MDETGTTASDTSALDPLARIAEVAQLIEALASRERVSGLTHSFYRYPARFSPEFARAAILAFTSPGDLVLDPFVGGGTTLVEGLSAGRRVAGTDLNQLAVFVARAKTTLLTEKQARKLVAWALTLDEATTEVWHDPLLSVGERARHVPWNVRRTLSLALQSALTLPDRRVRRVARASVLRLGQWALDGRKHVPTRRELLRKHVAIAAEMARGSAELTRTAKRAFELARHEVERQRRVAHVDAESLVTHWALPPEWGAPKLVLTSPPYHGVHMIYHRWQVEGRRETPAPYWLSGCQDGRPASYYTFGRRVYDVITELRPEYFEKARRAFRALHSLCNDDTVVVQLVGFSNPAIQLPLYRATMREAGFVECEPTDVPQGTGLTRSVPNRKWYLEALNRYSASGREFLLIHRRAL